MLLQLATSAWVDASRDRAEQLRAHLATPRVGSGGVCDRTTACSPRKASLPAGAACSRTSQCWRGVSVVATIALLGGHVQRLGGASRARGASPFETLSRSQAKVRVRTGFHAFKPGTMRCADSDDTFEKV